MNKYKVICTIWKLPKHQRRKLHGKPVSKSVLGHNLIIEKSFYITAAELDAAWDQLKALYERGEAEVRNPDGTLLRFVKEEVKDPPKEKVQKLPAARPVPSYDMEDLENITPVEPKKEEKPKKKKRGRPKKKKAKKEESVDE